jgi:hypothetical protein
MGLNNKLKSNEAKGETLWLSLLWYHSLRKINSLIVHNKLNYKAVAITLVTQSKPTLRAGKHGCTMSTHRRVPGRR